MDTKKYEDQIPVDEGLQGNETIEEAILVLQQEPTEEMLAHTLTVIRRRARAKWTVHCCCYTTGGCGEQFADPGDPDRG